MKRLLSAILTIAFAALAFGTLFFPAVVYKDADLGSVKDQISGSIDTLQVYGASAVNEVAGEDVLNTDRAAMSRYISGNHSGISMAELRAGATGISSFGISNSRLKTYTTILNVCAIVTLLGLAFAVISALTGVGKAGSIVCFMMFVWLGLAFAAMKILNNAAGIELFAMTMWPVVGVVLGVITLLFGNDRK